MKFVLFALSLLTLSTANSPVKVDGYKIGDIATDFSLPNVDGDMVSLGDFKDAKGFIVIFTCNYRVTSRFVFLVQSDNSIFIGH